MLPTTRRSQRIFAKVPVALLTALLAVVLPSDDLVAQAAGACVDTATVTRTRAGDVGAETLRLTEIMGASSASLRMLRRGFDESRIQIRPAAQVALTFCQGDATDRSWRVLPATARGTYNSAYPVDRANGAMRGGKGLGAALALGASLRWGPVTAQLAPLIGYETNSDFAVYDSTFGARSRWAQPFLPTIDWPQRFGDDGYSIVDAGRSYLRGDFGAIGLGVSNEVLVFGAARRYPLLLGDAAPGFPHMFLGTNRDVSIGIGTIDVQLLWAALRESEFFNDDPGDDDRRFTGLFGSFRPAGLDGLVLGVGLTLDTAAEGSQSVLDLLTNPLQFQDNPEGNGIYSAYFRWVLPESGFELYGEWARDDATRDVEDFLLELDHASAWTVGFQKATETGIGLVRVGFELADLKTRDTSVRARTNVRFYTHRRVTQGHTNDGQLLGAWIGPGSDAQFLEIDLFRENKRLGVFLERVRWNDDVFERFFAADYAFRGHDAEFAAGFRGSWSRGSVLLDGSASVSHRKNRGFIGLDGINRDFRRENNLRLDLTVVWAPAGSMAWRPF